MSLQCWELCNGNIKKGESRGAVTPTAFVAN
nr:MAG TPA: hypothetical protein [Caudoviricetes sp.]